MIIDDEIKILLYDIQQAVAEKFQVEYSIQELDNIIDSQFTAAVYAFTKGVEVRMPKIGHFKRNHLNEIYESKIELRELKGLITEEEWKKHELKIKLAKLERNQIRRKNTTIITLDELLEMDHVRDRTIYKNLNKGNKVSKNDVFYK